MKKAQQIIDRMNQYGLRITEQRKSLAKIFAETHQPLSPTDVYKRMNSTYKGLSLDTVYRNIRKLVDIGAIEPVGYPEGVRYQMRCTDHDHYHHLVCLRCEQAFPLPMCPIDSGIDIPENFKVVRHTFEVQGYCETCWDGD